MKIIQANGRKPMKSSACQAVGLATVCLAAVACGGNGMEENSQGPTETVQEAIQLGRWVASNSNLPRPANAFLVGNDSDHGPLFFCRAWYQNGVHPGKYCNGTCYIPWGG